MNGTRLWYRGFNNLVAFMDASLSANPGRGAAGGDLVVPSLAGAERVLISGSSAGGLTTYLHADFMTGLYRTPPPAAAAAAAPHVPGLPHPHPQTPRPPPACAARIHAVNARATVKAMPEVGFFVDAASIWGSRHLYTDVYTRVAAFANVTGGAAAQVNADCVAATPAADRWQCFMAQYTYPHIATPTFILNSAVDEWQTSNILAPNPDVSEYVSTYAPFKPCIAKPAPPGAGSGCNATQWAQWDGYAEQFAAALNASLAATPAAYAAHNGGFITSCPIHTTAIGGLSHRIRIGGTTMYEALSAWFFETAGPGGAQYWWHDVAYPGDTSCPKPTDVDALVPF